jgi:single-strand DNA-binding protein
VGNGLNKVLLIGQVADVPERRETPTGRSVTSFTLAIPHVWTVADGEQREETEWLNIVVWGALSRACGTSLTPGRQVYVEGRLQTRRWEDANGSPFFRTEVIANDLLLLDGDD